MLSGRHAVPEEVAVGLEVRSDDLTRPVRRPPVVRHDVHEQVAEFFLRVVGRGQDLVAA